MGCNLSVKSTLSSLNLASSVFHGGSRAVDQDSVLWALTVNLAQPGATREEDIGSGMSVGIILILAVGELSPLWEAPSPGQVATG